MGRQYQVAPLLALFVALAGGCDRPPEFAVVEGTVTRGGRPAAQIEVAFYADEDTHGPRASGLTDSSGRYRLQTEAGQTGAVVGRHRVCLYDRSPSAMMAGGRPSPGLAKKMPAGVAGSLPPAAGKQQAPRVPEAYNRPWETPLRAEVRPGTQSLDFQLP